MIGDESRAEDAAATGHPPVLKRARLPDPFMHALYAVSPYRACGHGCAYCDGRAEKYYVDGDFERDIVARDHVPEALTAELAKIRERGIVAIGSGVTDAYQPLETERCLTPRCLEPIERAGLPALVMTKSALIRRDLDLWTRLTRGPGAVVIMSITSVDESVRELMEPGASPFKERIETLAAFKEAGCTIGVLAMPLLPGITDGEASFRTLIEALSPLEPAFIMPGGLTLRPGRQKDHYLSRIAEHHPNLLGLYETLYDENRASGMPRSSASRALFQRCSGILAEAGIPRMLPFNAYAPLMPLHDAVHILLRDMIELFGSRGVDTRRLRSATDRYDTWLLDLRSWFRRHRSEPAAWLSDRFMEAVSGEEIATIVQNDRLIGLIKEIVLEGSIFDYRSLKTVN